VCQVYYYLISGAPKKLFRMTIPSTISHIVRAAVLAVPQVRPYLSAAAKKAAGDVAAINAAYHDTVTQALMDYFNGGSMVGARNAFKQAMVEAFGSAFDSGWMDGGGELPADTDALAWLNGRVDQEMGYIEQVFVQAKELKKDPAADSFAWATERADGYTQSVASVYNAGLLLAKKNQMLWWRLGKTEQHCQSCLQLNGQSHRAFWYIAHDYIPRKPGAAMECKGYYCDCHLEDRSGNEVTI
jgi:hypothetical protein